jgi:hypothetical protein
MLLICCQESESSISFYIPIPIYLAFVLNIKHLPWLVPKLPKNSLHFGSSFIHNYGSSTKAKHLAIFQNRQFTMPASFLTLKQSITQKYVISQI